MKTVTALVLATMATAASTTIIYDQNNQQGYSDIRNFLIENPNFSFGFERN